MPGKVEHSLYNNQEDFWTNYKRGRPQVPASFYERFYAYHAAHGGSFDTVHDVGAGFGLYSLSLSQKFARLIVSEPAEKALDVAKHNLGADSLPGANQVSGPPKFTFLHEGAEESSVASASVDAVFLCNCIHWTKTDAAVACAARQLRPRGTLFIALNGVCKFDEPAGLQQAWFDLIDTGMRRVNASMSPARRDEIYGVQDSGGDYVAIPSSDFEDGVQRIKLNTMGDPLAFTFGLEAHRTITGQSMIGEKDRLSEEVDKEWFFEAGLDDLRATAGSYPLNAEPSELAPHWETIERLLGGGKVKGRWTVSIIMATKR